jgi:hypothetical protein
MANTQFCSKLRELLSWKTRRKLRRPRPRRSSSFSLELLDARVLLSGDVAGAVPVADILNSSTFGIHAAPTQAVLNTAEVSWSVSDILRSSTFGRQSAAALPVQAAPTKADLLWDRIGSFFTPPAQYAGDAGGYASLLELPDGSRITTVDQWNQHRAEIRDYWLQQIGPWPAEIEHPRILIHHGTTVSPEGITREDIELETFPGTTSRAFLLTPPGNGPFPAALDLWYFPEESAGVTTSLGGHVDFAYQLAKRGFISLAMTGSSYRGDPETGLEPLSMLAYEANNAYNFLADQASVKASQVGIVGHSFGGKWALFSGALTDNFAAVAVSDPGVVWDETDVNANYWEPWYLGYDVGAATQRSPGVPAADNPRTGAYARLYESGHDLTELHALIAPRPFLVAGGSVDTESRWQPLNRDIELNEVLGHTNRVAMMNRPSHFIDANTNERVTDFFDYFLNT